MVDEKTKEKLFKEMRDALFAYDKDKIIELTKKSLELGIDPLETIEKGLAEPIRVIGDMFERMEIFLPELMMAAEAMKAGVDILKEVIEKQKKSVESKGRIVIGTIEGDIHDIGKTIVVALLRANGFEVYDIGKDVPIPKFLEEAEKVNADIIGVSALLTTTMTKQRDLIKFIVDSGKRDKYFIIVGGAPTTEEWAKEIGADGWAPNAVEAVKLCERLMQKKRKKK
ncbi:MAG: corrinoid protein [Candidatus Asgardarchaeia archaeon]